MAARSGILLTLTGILFGGALIHAQQTLPDRVVMGTNRVYWVDSVNAAGSTYTWLINGQPVQAGTTCRFSYTWPQPGTYVLSVFLTTPAGCNSPPASGQIIVDPPDTHTVLLSADRSVVCEGESVHITATPGQPITNEHYRWYRNGKELPDLTSADLILTPADGDQIVVHLMQPGRILARSDTLVLTVTPTVGPPVFELGASSMRTPGAGTVTYNATADHSTGITYSLDAASLAGGCTINPATGAVSFSAGWTGTTVITASAAGCNGPATSTHQVFPDTGKPVLLITVRNRTKRYGAPVPPLDDLRNWVTYSGLINGDTAPETLPVLTTTADQTSPVGTYPVTASGAADPDYHIEYVQGTLRVRAADLSIIADNKTILYGQAIPNPTLTYSPDLFFGIPLAVSPTVYHTANAASPIGNYPIIVSGASDPNYEITHRNGTLYIRDKYEPVITWDNPADIYYGTLLGSTQLNATASTLGSFSYDPPAGTRLEAGDNQPLSCDFTPLDTETYTTVSKSVTINVLPKIITVTANPQTKVYRVPADPDPELTYTFSPALENGDSFSGALERASGEDPGDYPISIGTLDAGPNYELVFVGNILTITDPGATPITVTATPGQNKLVGQADPTLQYTWSPDLATGDSFSGQLSRTSGEAPGTYPITRGNLRTLTRRTIHFISNTFEILDPADRLITITVLPGQGKSVGEADPPFLYTWDSLLWPGVSLTGTLAREPGEAVGTYYILPGSLKAPEGYSLNVTNEVFTIRESNVVPITVTANPGQWKYVGNPDPAFTYRVLSGNSGARFTGSLSRLYGEAIGVYQITKGTLDAGDKYLIQFIPADFTIVEDVITPITVAVTKGQGKVYGDPEPEYLYTVTPGNSGAKLTGKPVRYPAGEDVNGGPYRINQGDLDAGEKFPITFVSGDFTISPKPITVTAEPKSKEYKDPPPNPDPPLTYSVSPPLIAGDRFTGELKRKPGETPGTYVITIGNLDPGSNYSMNFVQGIFSITNPGAKHITVTADPGQHKYYGDPDPEYYTFTDDLPEGEEVHYTGRLERVPGVNAGTYAITQGSLSAGGDYDITFTSSTFTITKAALVISADNKTKAFGDPLPVWTATYSGLKNGDTGTAVLPSFSTTATALSIPGTYPITVCCADDPNYSITYANGVLAITDGTLQPVITWNNPADIVYGTLLSGLQLNATANVAGTFTYAPAAGTLLSAGSGQILSVLFTPDDPVRYNPSTTTVKINVLPRGVTVTALNAGKVYGEADPALNYSADPELLSFDQFSGGLVRDPGEDAGDYPIRQGSLTAGDNYAITFVPATFTITPGMVEPVVTWTDPAPVVYGTLLDGTQLNAKSDVPGTFSYSPPAGTLLGSGSGQVLSVTFTPHDTTKYKPVQASVHLTVERKPIEVCAVPETKEYDGTSLGQAIPVIYPGLVAGDIPDFSQVFENKIAGTGKTILPAGRVISALPGDQYAIRFVPGREGVITRREAGVVFSGVSRAYDGTTRAGVSGIVVLNIIPGDSVAISGIGAEFETPDAGIGKTIIVKEISLSGPDACNYLPIAEGRMTADVYPLRVGSSLEVSDPVIRVGREPVRVIARIYGDTIPKIAALTGASVDFRIDGRELPGNEGKSSISMKTENNDLIVNVFIGYDDFYRDGTLPEGFRLLSAHFYPEGNNHRVEPNPATATLVFQRESGQVIGANPVDGPMVEFRITLAESSPVTIDLFQLNGQLAGRLFEGILPGGITSTISREHYLSQGIYPYRVCAGKTVHCGKLVIIRNF